MRRTNPLLRKDKHGRCDHCTPTTYATFRDATLESVRWQHYCGKQLETVTEKY